LVDVVGKLSSTQVPSVLAVREKGRGLLIGLPGVKGVGMAGMVRRSLQDTAFGERGHLKIFPCQTCCRSMTEIITYT
jgi:hypothetical protein